MSKGLVLFILLTTATLSGGIYLPWLKGRYTQSAVNIDQPAQVEVSLTPKPTATPIKQAPVKTTNIAPRQTSQPTPTPSPTSNKIACSVGGNIFYITQEQCINATAPGSYTGSYTTPTLSPQDYTADFQKTVDSFQKDSEAIVNSVLSPTPAPANSSLATQQPTPNPTDAFGGDCSSWDAAGSNPQHVGCP